MVVAMGGKGGIPGTEDQRQRVGLAGARGSVLWPGGTGPGVIPPTLSPFSRQSKWTNILEKRGKEVPSAWTLEGLRSVWTFHMGLENLLGLVGVVLALAWCFLNTCVSFLVSFLWHSLVYL